MNDDHLKRLNQAGKDWASMTEEEQIEQREKWDAIVSNPDNLNCTCPRTFCRMNRNCRNCVALNRYYDCLPDCVRDIAEKMQDGIPANKKFDLHSKMQASGRPPGSIDPTEDANTSRERLHKLDTPELVRARFANWDSVVKSSKNTACKCPRTDCWYHGNCVKCTALHRYFDGFPECIRYIADGIEEHVKAYNQANKT